MAASIWVGATPREPAPADAAGPETLFAAVKRSIGDAFPRHAARYLELDESRVETAVDLFVSAILQRLARLGATPEGAARVFADLGSSRVDSDLLVTADRLLADVRPEQLELPHPGERAAQALFGRWTGSVALQVGAATGLKADAVWPLLGLTTPLVYAALRDHIRDRGLDAAALRRRLAAEYPGARAGRRPGYHALTDAIEGATQVARSAGAHAWNGIAPRNRRALAQGLLVVAIAGAAALAWRVGPTPVDAAAGPNAAGTVDARGDASRSAALEGLRAFLASDSSQVEYVFVLDGVKFEPASATLTSASNAELKQLAAVLAIYPEARITLEAHPGEDAETDRALPERRALAVRAALAGHGVDPPRVRHRGIDGVDRLGARVEARVTRLE